MRDAGTAVLLVSVELDEIMGLSDRILVMFDGRIVGEIAGGDADERTIGLMMAGINPNEDPNPDPRALPGAGPGADPASGPNADRPA